MTPKLESPAQAGLGLEKGRNKQLDKILKIKKKRFKPLVADRRGSEVFRIGKNTHTISFGWGVYKGKDGSILDYEAIPAQDESIYSSKLPSRHTTTIKEKSLSFRTETVQKESEKPDNEGNEFAELVQQQKREKALKRFEQLKLQRMMKKNALKPSLLKNSKFGTKNFSSASKIKKKGKFSKLSKNSKFFTKFGKSSK